MVEVIERLTLDDLLLKQKVIVCGDWVVHVRREAQLDMPVVDWLLLSRLHILDHVLENLDLIDTNFDAEWQRLGRLVRFLEPRVGHNLLETVAQLGVRHKDIFDQVLNFLAQETGKLVASV